MTPAVRKRGVFPRAGLEASAPSAAPAAIQPAEDPTLVMHVFRDETRARWRRIRVVALIALILALVVGRLCASALSTTQPNASLETVLPFDLAGVSSRALAIRVSSPPFVSDQGATPAPAARAPLRALAAPLAFGWVDVSEDSALASFAAHAASLTDVAIEGVHVDALGAISSERYEPALATARERHVRTHIVVDGVKNGTPRPADITALGRDAMRTARFAEGLSSRLARDGAAGVVLDFGDDEADENGAAREALVRAVRRAVGPRTIAISVRAGATRASLQLASRLADHVLVHAHLDPEDAASPAPPAPRAWLRDAVASASLAVPAEKLVVLLPTRGSGWPVRPRDLAPAGAARSFEWTEVLARSRLAGVRPIWNAGTANVLVVLPGVDGVASSALVAAEGDGDSRKNGRGATGRETALVAWFVDGASFADGVAVLRRAGLQHVGVDTLGGEDPRVWSVLAAGASDSATLHALETIPRAHEWSIVGHGVEIRTLEEERDGEARIRVAPDRSVLEESYRVLPADVSVVRRGAVG
jgi:hypothetical protein